MVPLAFRLSEREKPETDPICILYRMLFVNPGAGS